MTSIKKLAISAAIWTIIDYGLGQILRLISNIILTHLLQPQYFGIMAIAHILRNGIELFSDLGIAQSIVNNKRGEDPAFLNTAWTLQIIRGFIVWFFCLLMTFPVAKFYNNEQFFWLIPVVGLFSVFNGFTSTSINTLQRRMDLRKLTRYEVTLYTFSLSTGIILAWVSPTLWSLAIGTIVASIYRMISSHWLIKGYSNRFAWDKDAVQQILSFGKWMFLSSMLMFLSDQADRLILGKLLSFQMLGVYTVANTLACIPKEVIKQLSYKVIFPAISNQVDLPRSALRAKIIRQRRLILIGLAILLALLVTVGDLVISVLYNKNYVDATWMMPILSCGIWFSLLFYTISPALLAIGKPLYSAQSNLAGFILVSLGLPLAFNHYGMIGSIIVIAFSDLPLYLVNLYGLWREKLSCIAQDIQSTIFFLGILALFLTIRNGLGFGLPIHVIL